MNGKGNGFEAASVEAPWFTPAYRHRLVAFARRFVADEGEAEDVAQETLFRAGMGLDSLRSIERADAWLFRICRHTAIDHVRARRVRRSVWAPMPENGETWATAADAPPAEKQVSARPVDLGRLAAHDRLLMELHYHSGLTHVTLCRMTGLTPSALRVRLFRARRALLRCRH